MATQNINIVIRTAGGTTVVRQLNQIGQAATNAISPLARLQRQIDWLMSALAIGQIAKWADEWTSIANKVNVFTKSQQETNQVLEELYELSQRVRQPMGDMVNLYHRLTIGAKELGTSTKENLQFTESIGQALAVQGTTATQARGALLQLSQAMGMSRIRAQEFNSMVENLPLVLLTVAKNIEGTNGSISKLRARMLDGKLSAKEFFEAFTKGAPELAAMFEKTDKTFGQAFIVLENGIIKYVGEINRALGVSNKFFDIVSMLVKNLDFIGKALLVVGAGVATAFAPTIITAFAAALVSAAAAMGRLVLLLATNPFILIVTATAAVIAFGDSWLLGIDNITTVKDLFSAFVDTVTTGFATAASTISGWWESLVSTVSDFYSSASGMTKESVGSWFSAYTTFFSDVEGGFAGVARVIARIMDAIAGYITAGAVLIGRVFGGLPGVVGNIFKLVYNQIATWIEKALNVVIDGVNAIRSKVGMSLIDAVRIEKVQVDKKVFQDYGKDVASAVDDGFAIQGGFMEKQLNGILAKAAAGAKQRLAANAQKKAIDLSANRPDAMSGAPTGGKPDKVNSDFERYNKLTLERIALAAAELTATRELTKAESDRLKFMQDVDASKMTQDQKEMLKLRYEGIYAMEQEVMQRAVLRKAEEEDLQLRQKAYEALVDYSKQLDETFSDIAFETSLLGQNADAQRRMTALRQLDLDMQRALAAVRDDPTAAAQVRAQNEEAQKRMIAALDQQIAKQNELNASWQFGANTALTAYLKQVQDVAGAAERVFTNTFSAIEDGATQFLNTGKINISSFATSVVNDINRMIVKSYITGPLAAMVQGGMSSGSGAGGFIGSLFGKIFGGGPPIVSSYPKANGGWAPPNSLQEVNERGPELLSMGGRQYLMTGDKGGMVSPNEGRGGITQHNHFHVTGPIDRRTQTQLAANVGMVTQHALRRNG